MTSLSRLVVTVLAALTIACGDTIVNVPTTPTPIPTNPIPVKADRVEFHVVGNAIAARVKYSSSVEGLNQVTTVLPFQTLINSNSDGAFLFLEATPTGYSALVANPFVAVQIFVNGSLFREAATTSSFNETVSVSGTYRR